MLPSKEQERKALEQIKKILKGLGDNPDNSYVCRAFDGCVEDAESNIENDFADSYRSRYEYREAECERLEEEVEKLTSEKNRLADRVELLEGAKTETANHYKEEVKKYRELFDENQQKYHEASNGLRAANDKIAEQELEIIKLKAKLYDMMVADK